MTRDRLCEFVEGVATKFGIPGVAVGIFAAGREVYACHGVTSLDNPLPVDRDTLYLLGSLTKTYTATALMRLVAEGVVELHAPAQRYVPELALTDELASARITVLHLLNHTAGLDWGLIADTGEGDDALANYVAKMSDLRQIARPGERASYSQAGFNLAGRIVEKVTGMSYERAVASLLLAPLELSHSFFNRDDVMTHRFVVGHNRGDDGTLTIARLWRRSRGDNPGGGLVSSVSDQLRWARFHLGDGSAESGLHVLPADLLHQMRNPTVALRGSSLGEAIGISWFMRDVAGVPTFGHAGSANGQFVEFLLVPQRDFAVVTMSNAGPDGIPANRAIVRWALEALLGLHDADPQPLPYDEARVREVIGNYTNDVMTLNIGMDGAKLRLEVRMKMELRAAADKELPPDHAPFEFGLLPAEGDEYIITSGAFKGQRGFFTRDTTGCVVGVDLAGRLFSRLPDDLVARY